MIPGVPGDSLAYLNGEFLRLQDAKISVLDRGFIFGDGIYEVVPVYEGRPFRMAEHLARLERSLASIRIESPFDRAGWNEVVQGLIERSLTPSCVVYLQVTRGVAKRDHGFPAERLTPTVFGMTSPFTRPGAELREQGVSLVSISDERWLHCDIKSVSLLGNVLAKQRAVDEGADEVVQFRDGILTEGATCNVWAVAGGKLLGAPKNHLVLEGIRYGLMAELAQEAGIPFEMRPIARAEVENADELLVSSATREILPVAALDGKPVGAGRPGPVYAALRRGYDARIAALLGKAPGVPM
ncbi:D-amino acid aminotransferase [Bordetella genomosp. 11]|uniref:D-amino acid aminotransferase n=1 Tax=Bordetella genomosp. 11 TaxID=1416808 RepID=A0A261UNV3_9BORD|nr:D-amino acid aminotransferase [Bordetella genomosp. 11]OZI62950.1 D-amino acid aminotransferase [Bordetella genomosp. 11]